MTSQFEFTVPMLLGLVSCLTASLLLAALLVIAIVPPVQATVLNGLIVIANLLSKLADVGLPLILRIRGQAAVDDYEQRWGAPPDKPPPRS